MPGIVVNGVARFAVHSLFHGTQEITILDVKIDTTGSLASRPDALNDMCDVIRDAWDAHLKVHQVDTWSMTEVSFVDLDSASGSTGSQPEVTAGTNSSPPFPGNISALVTKSVGSHRGVRNGRMFFPAIPEDYTSDADPQHLTAAVITGMQANFDLFLGAITDTHTASSGDYDAALGVVHAPAALTPTFDEVEALIVTGRLGQQGRRRGY